MYRSDAFCVMEGEETFYIWKLWVVYILINLIHRKKGNLAMWKTVYRHNNMGAYTILISSF